MTINSYTEVTQVVLDSAPKIIWLASWYPSVSFPTNGDFIQRHAIALSQAMPVLVVHTVHDKNSVIPVRYEVRSGAALTEIIIYFKHSGQTDSLATKISYNRKFNRYTTVLLEHLIRIYGKPLCYHVHVPVKMGRIAIAMKRKWDIPYLVSEQSSKYLPGIEDGFDKRNWFYRYTVKSVFSNALAVSNVSKAIGIIIGKISGRDDIRVIHNTADTSLFNYQLREPAGFGFIHVSTLKSQKNISGILRVFQNLSKKGIDVHLTLVGGDEPELMAIKGDYGTDIPWLTLVGTVDHNEVPGYLKKAHCLVMFSRDENFPCAIVEALCCGLTVISSDAGGCPEAINQENGIVVAAGDENQLSSAIEHMLHHYSSYNRSEISRNGEKKYSYHQIASEFLDFYRSVGFKMN